MAGMPAKHVRLHSPNGTNVDLLIDTSGRWARLAGPARGPDWLLTQVRDGVSLLLLYTPGQEAAAIRALQRLFPHVQFTV